MPYMFIKQIGWGLWFLEGQISFHPSPYIHISKFTQGCRRLRQGGPAFGRVDGVGRGLGKGAAPLVGELVALGEEAVLVYSVYVYPYFI